MRKHLFFQLFHVLKSGKYAGKTTTERFAWISPATHCLLLIKTRLTTDLLEEFTE
jgi:hypothetical protein